MQGTLGRSNTPFLNAVIKSKTVVIINSYVGTTYLLCVSTHGTPIYSALESEKLWTCPVVCVYLIIISQF